MAQRDFTLAKRPSHTPQTTQLLSPRPFANQASKLEKSSTEPSVSPFNFSQVTVVDSSTSAPMPLQPKLTIGQPGDKYEQEADQVAAQTVQLINSPQGIQPQEDIQRSTAPEEEEDIQRSTALEEEEDIQRSPDPEEEEDIQRSPMTISPVMGLPIQRQDTIPVGPASNDFEQSLNQARSGGRSLEPQIQTKMGSAMGADFSGVKIHTDPQSDQLNRSIQAKAFTTGKDVFFRQGEYNPSSRSGQELLAHELTHVVQQTGNTVSRTFLQQSQNLNQGGHPTIQRVFQPVTTVNNAHLRNDGEWNTYVGNRIDSGSEIVVDSTQQKIESNTFSSNTTWTKAVNVTGGNWDWNTYGSNTTYIRDIRIGANKQYPQKADTDSHKPLNRRSGYGYKLNWHERIGEFVEIEDSVSTANTKVAKILSTGNYQRVNPATGQVDNLDNEEQFQLNTNALEQYLFNRLKTVLTDATQSMAWQSKLATDENVRKIMYQDGSKALRFESFGGATGKEFTSYYKWVTDQNGPFQRIREGADYVLDALEHWREYLYPYGKGVTIKSIDLSGSDLHESGLGVMFVKFNKPEGGCTDYSDGGDLELVVKPEERILEQKLFGTQDDSLANHINDEVDLAGSDEITTYKQKVDSGFGTLCEKVVGTQADKLPSDQIRPITQALKESLVFVLITGLTDLHGENVLWKDGKPYMIDADNALKLKFMTPDQATAQNGYKFYSDQASDTLRQVYESSTGYETKLMEALKDPGSLAQRQLLMKVKEIFSTSIGRTVPIETAVWGQRLWTFIAASPEGTSTDVPVPGECADFTKWQWCNYCATTVPKGKGAHAPGLEGEVGMKNGTDGEFRENVEAAQLFADFKVGQIPFYNYAYGNGHVLHNGQVIWSGQTITERMASLFELFPSQLNR